MKTVQHFTVLLRDRRGAVAVITAIVLAVLIGFIALSVDVGYVMVTKNELQNVADAAALAGARQLGANYELLSYTEQQSYVCDRSTIVSTVQEIALQNRAGGKEIIINDGDIEIGDWDADAKVWKETTLEQPDAVRVIARRDTNANSPITTFFAGIFGINTAAVSAKATAALTSLSKVDEGGLPIPVGISKKWFEKDEFCNQPIKMYPTGTLEGCAGWMTYDINPSSASRLKKILADLKDGTYSSPEAVAGETVFNFTGGTVASAFDNMKALFDAKKTTDDDGNPNTWTTTVVVYDWDDCSNPSKSIQIVGFATIVIDEVLESPDKIINAHVICENVEPERGGGGDYGTMGSIPGLVQ